MFRRAHNQLPLLAFGLSVAAIYGVALYVVSRLPQFDGPGLMAAAVTLDLTLLVPALYYVLLVRWRGWPALTVLPVFILGVVFAERIVPDGRRQVLQLISYAAVLAGLTLLALVVHRMLRLRRSFNSRSRAGADVHEALRESAQPILGSTAGSLFAYEIAVFYYALAGWRMPPVADERAFSYHRQNAYAPFAIAMSIAVVVETVAIHLLVQMWLSWLAWILTALSVYALIWLVGDTWAITRRPTRIDDGVLRLRSGLRWTIDVPVELIERCDAPSDGALARRTAGYVNLTLLGEPHRRVELSAPVEALGVYGLRRTVSTVDFQVDAAAAFDEALRESRRG